MPGDARTSVCSIGGGRGVGSRRVFLRGLAPESCSCRVDRVLNKAQLAIVLVRRMEMAARKRVGILLEFNYEDLEVCGPSYLYIVERRQNMRGTSIIILL